MTESVEKPRADRLEFVQALRGIAAMAVVMYHARIWIAGPAFLDLGPRLFENGAAGVDLFFVISGFIMVHTTWNSLGGVRSATRFFAKRIARIWPVYVITSFALFVTEGTLMKWAGRPRGLVHLVKAFTFYPQHKNGAPFLGWAPNGVGWTLNYEVWFYLLFAIAMLVGFRKRFAVLGGLFAGFLVVVPLLYTGHVYANAYVDYNMDPALLDLAANPMVWEFLAGAAIGFVYRSRFQPRNRELLGMFAVLSVTLVIVQQLSGEPQHAGPTGWGVPIVVMVLALALWNKAYPIKSPRALLWLGDVSFSLYLVHRIPQLGLARLIPASHSAFIAGGGYVLATTVIALVLAHFSYRYLEQGLATRFRTWLLHRVG